MHSKDKGDISEALILAKLLQQRKRVLIPFGDNARYDLAIDDNGILIRVQCKTARYRYGCIIFNTCSTNARIKQRGYKGEADLFIAYCPELDTYYKIKVSDCGENQVKLRIDQPKNNQNVGVRYAQDYEIS